jgi:RNA polymerase sigma-70 factor (ECF subfamily)
MDDATLVRQVLAGNTNAYAELVERWAMRITALCHARLGRADLAEELAQETLVRGFEELPSLGDPDRFGPWLAGIAANTCRDWLKSPRNAHVLLSNLPAEPLSPARTPAAEAELQDEIAHLIQGVEALPEECRIVLMLFYYQKSSYRDIAHVLDVSTATVNARLTRARALLRGRLSGAQMNGANSLTCRDPVSSPEKLP